jgi:hypothetical protein
VLVEGVVGGGVGAVAAVLPHLLLDLVSGEPLRTPKTLYAVILVAASPDLAGASSYVQVLQFTGVHLTLWLAVGVVAAYLVGLADVRPRAWTAVFSLIACVCATALYLAGVLSGPSEAGLPLWVGTLTGSGALAGVLVARHAGVLRQFERVSLTGTARHDLDVAYERECTSRALYRGIVERWPDDPTLDEMLSVSERRVAILAELLTHYDRQIPATREPAPNVPGTLAQAYRAAVHDEEQKVRMYDGFLLSIDEPRARETFSRLRWKASDDCLPQLHSGTPADESDQA